VCLRWPLPCKGDSGATASHGLRVDAELFERTAEAALNEVYSPRGRGSAAQLVLCTTVCRLVRIGPRPGLTWEPSACRGEPPVGAEVEIAVAIRLVGLLGRVWDDGRMLHTGLRMELVHSEPAP